MEQGRQQLAPGEVARRAENHERDRFDGDDAARHENAVYRFGPGSGLRAGSTGHAIPRSDRARLLNGRAGREVPRRDGPSRNPHELPTAVCTATFEPCRR